MDDAELAENLIATFQVDVLFPIAPSQATKAFKDKFPHLQMHLWGESLFQDKSCRFVDIRHPVSRAMALGDARSKAMLTKIVRPVWSKEDQSSALFSILFGDWISPYRAGSG